MKFIIEVVDNSKRKLTAREYKKEKYTLYVSVDGNIFTAYNFNDLSELEYLELDSHELTRMEYIESTFK